MDFILSWLREEWRTLVHAPMLLCLILIVGVFGGWRVRDLYDSQHEKALEDRADKADRAVLLCSTFKPEPAPPRVTINLPQPDADAPVKDWVAYNAKQQKKFDALSARFAKSEATAKGLKWQLDDCLADGEITKTIKALREGKF